MDVDRLYLLGRDAWPDIPLGREDFADHVARCADRAASSDTDIAPYASDLYLACAAACGDALAVGAVEQSCVVPAATALSRILTREEAEDVMQGLRERLFVGGDGSPRLLDYAGRGPLRAWVRASAIRAAFSFLRQHRRGRAREEVALFGLPTETEDPQFGHMRRRFRRDFQVAFEAASASLTSRERNLLRQHFIDGLSSEDLAVLYRVHRVTAFRWLRDARERLLSRTREELSHRLHASQDELDSLMRLIDSGLDVSVQRIFAGQ